MACGYAMFTDKLGVCFATAGPGAFNLFSGLAVAMSDSYPVLAISGYCVARVAAARARSTRRRASTARPTPRRCSRPPPRSRWLLTDVADTCDVLEEAVNLAFEGRPGPVHIHVPENLTHHGVEVRTTATCGWREPGPARSGARRGRSPTCSPTPSRKVEEGRRAGRLRRDPQRRRAPRCSG